MTVHLCGVKSFALLISLTPAIGQEGDECERLKEKAVLEYTKRRNSITKWQKVNSDIPLANFLLLEMRAYRKTFIIDF